MHRAQSDGDPARGRKRTADLLQGQVGLPGNQLQHLRAVLAQPGATIAAHRARARLAFSPPALTPPAGAADTDIKPRRRALPPSAIKPITRSLKSCEYGAGISPPMASSNRSFANQQAPENPSLYVSTRSETALAPPALRLARLDRRVRKSRNGHHRT